jgi:ribosomal protein S18 acetylase RimI-like enzyme
MSLPSVRPYRASDRADVAEICVRTGNDGADASGIYANPEILADVYALPYVDLEPGLDLVVDTGARVAGYLLAVADTRAFVERYRREWLPAFESKYGAAASAPSPDDRLIAAGSDPERMLIPGLDQYPAHLHIDLLPELQGQGFGRELIQRLLVELNSLGVPGVHLGVSETNRGARAFYARLGFRPLASGGAGGILLGISTGASC